MHDNSKETIFTEADKIVNGPRQDNYDHPFKNFTRIAKMWSAYKGVEFDWNDVGQMLALVKVARLASTPDHHDSHVDQVGYPRCLEIIRRFLQENGADTPEKQEELFSSLCAITKTPITTGEK